MIVQISATILIISAIVAFVFALSAASACRPAASAAFSAAVVCCNIALSASRSRALARAAAVRLERNQADVGIGDDPKKSRRRLAASRYGRVPIHAPPSISEMP